MIEVTISEIAGVRFYTDIKILEPDDKVGGFAVHGIPYKIVAQDAEFMRAIKAVGLRRVGRDVSCRVDLYAQFPVS
ncbi:hypothetical protein LCGC14_0416830 [marine sediment metagenome]|uniref:Uncharacterized protein n=1 Tax=marine sediment metagenome TaxID=412755 RepID=A0A0F9SY40_9ZZZZ